MDYMKYVIIEVAGIEVPILFSSIVNHSDMAMKPISAGFFTASPCEHDRKMALYVKCFGKSTSLKIESRPDKDAEIIHRDLMRHMRE